ncbi:hypothetical protein BDDG_12113 [Blastomyces dermatitidis ATCC 18188]|uniref:Uncharacterized protein n=1 Tax=Ajellomyces dermatitidis (strain ATCC 18188 / CBS 674.68) TaxID=653446 RepID=A0A0J9EQD9_AJEDA|nr:hypothetical protein BDDG_12113 [Blastomyces dermatitidis ATCC 18188]
MVIHAALDYPQHRNPRCGSREAEDQIFHWDQWQPIPTKAPEIGERPPRLTPSGGPKVAAQFR